MGHNKSMSQSFGQHHKLIGHQVDLKLSNSSKWNYSNIHLVVVYSG